MALLLIPLAQFLLLISLACSKEKPNEYDIDV